MHYGMEGQGVHSFYGQGGFNPSVPLMNMREQDSDPMHLRYPREQHAGIHGPMDHPMMNPESQQELTKYLQKYPGLTGAYPHFPNGLDAYEYLYGEHTYADAQSYMGDAVPERNQASDFMGHPEELASTEESESIEKSKMNHKAAIAADLTAKFGSFDSARDKKEASDGEVIPLFEHPAAYGHASEQPAHFTY